MRKELFSPAWYGDNTIEGDFVYLVRSIEENGKVITGYLIVNGARQELPGNNVNLLFIVTIRFQNQIVIAGQGHQDGKNWLWKDDKWNDLGPSFATNPCAFGGSTLYFICGNNQYKIFDLETNWISPVYNRQIGANGIRYIDFSQSPDGIITGDYTYGPQPYNISQWTKRKEIVVGQSYLGGCVALYNNVRYLVEPGDTQFIRFHEFNNRISIAIIKMPENSIVFYWLTVDEISKFPIEGNDNKAKGPVNQ